MADGLDVILAGDSDRAATQANAEPSAAIPRHCNLPDTSRVPGGFPILLRMLRRPARAAFGWRHPTRVWFASRVPRHGPVIMAPNHIGMLDGPLSVAFSPRRDTFALAKKELFGGIAGELLTLAGQIPVDRQQVDVGAVRRAVRVLRDDHALVVFPEGRRDDGLCRRIFPGVVYLAMITGAPIVPMAFLGTRAPATPATNVPPRGSSVEIVYGRPVEIPRTPWPRRPAALAQWTERLREVLAAHVASAVAVTGAELPGRPVT